MKAKDKPLQAHYGQDSIPDFSCIHWPSSKALMHRCDVDDIIQQYNYILHLKDDRSGDVMTVCTATPPSTAASWRHLERREPYDDGRQSPYMSTSAMIVVGSSTKEYRVVPGTKVYSRIDGHVIDKSAMNVFVDDYREWTDIPTAA